MTCPASYGVTQADLDAGSFTNTATADSTETGPDTDSETVTLTQTPSLSIVKTALPATYSTVGQVINYSFQVTNSGNVSLSGPFTVSDDQATDESCPATASLAPGASITCTASYTITQGDLNAGSVTNIAAATNGTVTSPPDSETVTAVQVVDPAVTKSGDPATASIGDSIVFTLVITNNGNTVATNVRIVDVIPSFLTVTNVIAAPPATIDNSAGNTVDLLFATVAPADTYTVTITTVVNSSATPPGGSNIVDLTADVDNDPTNNTDSAPITIVVGALGAPETGFAPGRLTVLPSQPKEDAYVTYGDLSLEIPKLGLQTSIIGVSQSGGSWDVSWLGEAAGYLNGTAFPTWSGNSVITAHVTLPSGLAGPFADLKSLRFGDQVIVHGWGERYIYEIRELDLVSPADRQIFRHEERSWLTLVTCHGYDERENAYRWRIAARAVLVSIEAEETRAVLAHASVDTSSTDLRPPALSSGR
jgi:LPXTG-site transpeptidase (sortase) family protein